ncbi:aspartyl protease family protein [Alicyclobacillus sp. SO9]|uniref:aspartyl protease family protein n=1 Tax=Alicyclobacillus sp. SO9 TaxID=2665646 RepID=UPI0018E8B84E|nr:aspartyl protease family protein [Alicyclobacillus sp. SO9]QQE78911.1 aspartyl protease family protein [Alicyclobacillus sp. SO9]
MAPIEIIYNERRQTIEDVVIDTGAVRSIIHVDAVELLDINPNPTDPISRMYGVGGEEFSFRKRVDGIRFAGVHVSEVMLDFGRIDGINGLIGLDILRPGGFVVDLRLLEIKQNKQG